MTRQLELVDVLGTIKSIRLQLEQLEERLASPEVRKDPIQRRRELLESIYRHGNSMDREDLLPRLEAAGTDIRWVGQQVKKGYLTVIPVPGSTPRYAVTQKAVKDLRLRTSDEEESLEWAKLSEAALAEDWNSPEDAIYDEL
jgi:hypothetical protein